MLLSIYTQLKMEFLEKEFNIIKANKNRLCYTFITSHVVHRGLNLGVKYEV